MELRGAIMWKGGIFRAAPLFASLAMLVSPALAKHVAKEPSTNIFTPPASAMTTPSFVTKKPAPGTATATSNLPRSILDGSEEPRWDIVKALPDLSPDQNKAIGKLQQDTQKSLNVMRTQLNEAQQELNELKAHRTPAPKADGNPALALLSPDGKPYHGPLLGTEEMGMDPAEESMDDVQAQIDGLKEHMKEANVKAASQARALLTASQLNELELMRQGRLVVDTPKNILVDSPSEPNQSKSKKKHELATSNNAGNRVLRSILSAPAKGLRGLEQI